MNSMQWRRDSPSVTDSSSLGRSAASVRQADVDDERDSHVQDPVVDSEGDVVTEVVERASLVLGLAWERRKR